MLNDKKICFIVCSNDEKYEHECMRYVNCLEIPEGYEIEWITILEAKSMAGGYNEAMRASDAKYKVYLHQDVFIINKNFLKDVLKIFENAKIGMIGMVGNIYLPKCGVQWYGERIGQIITRNYETKKVDLGNISIKKPYKSVVAIDGMMMITQYDIPWREDIFDGFDFYDSSQSQEFICAGYEVVVPHMDEPWVIHDDGVMNLKNYHNQRKKFVKEYVEK